MEKVQKEVEKLLSKRFIGKQYALEYGTSFDRIPFAILTTTVVWYKVRLICCVKIDASLFKERFPDKDFGDDEIIVQDTSCYTKGQLDTFVKTIKDDLANGRNQCIFKNGLIEDPVPLYFARIKLPSWVTINPNGILSPGDLIFSSFAAIYHHAAIYIGNGEVIHVSGHGGGKGGSVARRGKFSDFVQPGGTVWEVKCFYRLRKPSKTVEIAKDYAKNSFRKAQYNILAQNCQHFVTLCALGLEVLFDAGDPSIDRFVHLEPYKPGLVSQIVLVTIPSLYNGIHGLFHKEIPVEESDEEDLPDSTCNTDTMENQYAPTNQV